MACLLFFLNLLLFVFFSSCLDVSWIPSDPDGPLPLSKRYHEALNKLCIMIKNGSKLPKEIENKVVILEKMCQKLEKSSNNLLPDSFSSSSSSIIFYFIFGGVIIYVIYKNKSKVMKYFPFNSPQSYSRGSISNSNNSYSNVTQNDIKQNELAREARLKKFTHTD